MVIEEVMEGDNKMDVVNYSNLHQHRNINITRFTYQSAYNSVLHQLQDLIISINHDEVLSWWIVTGTSTIGNMFGFIFVCFM